MLPGGVEETVDQGLSLKLNTLQVHCAEARALHASWIAPATSKASG